MTTVSMSFLGKELTLNQRQSVIPRALARSALFSSLPANSKRKVYTEEVELFPWGDPEKAEVKIYQRTGKQLTQSEESVWLELIRHAVNSTPSEITGADGQRKVRVCFTANSLLRSLGKAIDRKNRADLLSAIARIGDVRIRVATADNAKGYTANLLDFATERSAEYQSYVCYVDMALAHFFTAASWSFIDLEQRRALKGNPLAQWLHSHYSTHQVPFPVGHQKLKHLCGRGAHREADWLEKLNAALAELATATGWTCTLKNGLVDIKKRKSAKKQITENKAPPSETVPPSAPRYDYSRVELSNEDKCLLENWLARYQHRWLVQMLRYYGIRPDRYANGNDVRELMHSMLMHHPDLLERRLQKLRAPNKRKIRT